MPRMVEREGHRTGAPHGCALATLFVPLAGTPEDEPALAGAFALARRFGAHVEGFHAGPGKGARALFLSEGLSAAAMRELEAAARAEADEQARAARERLEAAAALAGLRYAEEPETTAGPTYAWRREDEAPEEAAARRARLFDLAVMAGAAALKEGGRQAVAEALLADSGRPLLLVSPSAGAEIGRSVMVTWNGSAEAARAVALAYPLLAAADRIAVVTAQEGRARDAEPEALARHLAWHGLDAEPLLMPVQAGGVADAVLREARARGADLLIMGAYGRGRLAELVLGGMTRRMLAAPDIAVFMAR